jgi:hypothetical protein
LRLQLSDIAATIKTVTTSANFALFWLFNFPPLWTVHKTNPIAAPG